MGGDAGTVLGAGRPRPHLGDRGGGARVLEVLESIREDDPLGLLIGNGCAVTGKTPGVARVPVAKGQSLSAYDPRVLKGTGVTYATVPMGADHTCGNVWDVPDDDLDKMFS
jgi:aldehyde:ferredoxin oxidoreductase